MDKFAPTKQTIKNLDAAILKLRQKAEFEPAKDSLRTNAIIEILEKERDRQIIQVTEKGL